MNVADMNVSVAFQLENADRLAQAALSAAATQQPKHLVTDLLTGSRHLLHEKSLHAKCC